MKPRLELLVEATHVRASLVQRRAPIWSADVPYTTVETMPAAIRAALQLAASRRRPNEVSVRLSVSLVQWRTLGDLPPVGSSDLRKLVARSTSRYFRQNGHPLVSDAQWSAPDKQGRRVACLAAADRNLIESIISAAAAEGVMVEGIVPTGEVPTRLSLLPEHSRQHRKGWIRVAVFGGATAALWLVVSAGTLVSVLREDRWTSQQLERLAAPQEALQRARRALDSASSMVQELEASRVEQGQMARRFALLGGALPDSTVLTSLAIDSSGTVALVGLSRRSSQVAASLERVTGAGRIRLVAQGAGDAPGREGWEQFTVSSARILTP